MISVIFIRHGATEGNIQKKYIGRTDEPLCDLGINQAQGLREHKFPAEYIFVSPMKRAMQTAEVVFPSCEYIVVDEFKETDFGTFEGKSALELADNKDYKAWVDSGCSLPIPNGEDICEFKKRCAKAFTKAVESVPDGSSASFVVHGGVIMAIMEAFCADGGNFYDYHIANGEFLTCRFENGKLYKK